MSLATRASSSRQRCTPIANTSVAPPSANSQSRRALLLGALVALPVATAPLPSHAYGGSKTLRAVDAGSGNKDYDDLMAAIKKRREEAAKAQQQTAAQK